MIKSSGYKQPEDLPIDISAHDPLAGELLFGDDKRDELRNRYDYATPTDHAGGPPNSTGRTTLDIKLATSKLALERHARAKEDQIDPNLGRNLRRFIARTQAAMELGVTPQELVNMYYGGRLLADPIRISRLGFEAEARYLHALTQRAAPPTEQAMAEGSDPVLAVWAQTRLANRATEEAERKTARAAELASRARHAQLYERDEASWLDPILAETEYGANPPPVGSSTTTPPGQQQQMMKDGDAVQDNMGNTGTVTDATPDGKFRVTYTGGPMHDVNYNPDAAEKGIVRRSVKEPMFDNEPVLGRRVKLGQSGVVGTIERVLAPELFMVRLDDGRRVKMSKNDLRHLPPHIAAFLPDVAGDFSKMAAEGEDKPPVGEIPVDNMESWDDDHIVDGPDSLRKIADEIVKAYPALDNLNEAPDEELPDQLVSAFDKLSEEGDQVDEMGEDTDTTGQNVQQWEERFNRLMADK